ncbi:RdgB/HAM1 family non-canonical purine NTP pyrophosphatase [soil metagenome]
MHDQSKSLVLATRNPGKVAELTEMLSAVGVDVFAAADLGAPEVVEDADSLEGNARKKAAALNCFSGLPAIADDTGLEVDALCGAPGVYSARYAGPDADDAANRKALLAALAGASNRRARFRTVLVYMEESGEEVFEGVCEGTITHAEAGTGGFGYDAIFAPDGAAGKTFAEMDSLEKGKISHRGRALRHFADFLKSKADTK